MILALLALSPVGLIALMGGGMTAQCIRRGFGSIKGCPLPVGWWREPVL